MLKMKVSSILNILTVIDDLEVNIAGDEEERKIMMPLAYIDSHREKANVEVSFSNISQPSVFRVKLRGCLRISMIQVEMQASILMKE